MKGTPEMSVTPTGSTIPLETISATLMCGFQLVPRVRTALLELGDNVSIADVRSFLNGGSGGSGPLVSVARTKYERDSLSNGYSQLIAAIEKSRRPGRARSARLAWIIADSRMTRETEIDPQTVGRIAELELDAQLGSDYQNWLPWMSLGMVNHFRRWRQPRIRTMRRAMFKLSAGSDAALPWEAGYSRWQGQLPMQALYRHEPSRLLEETVAAFSSLGLTSINDLRCCHPDAVAASKAKGQPLFVLYRVLEQEGTSG